MSTETGTQMLIEKNIHNSQRVETTQVSISWWTDAQVRHIRAVGQLLAMKRERAWKEATTHENILVLWSHKRLYSMWSHIYEIFIVGKTVDIKGRVKLLKIFKGHITQSDQWNLIPGFLLKLLGWNFQRLYLGESLSGEWSRPAQKTAKERGKERKKKPRDQILIGS